MIHLLQGDITTLEVDCVVNATNENLMPRGGVCGAIHFTFVETYIYGISS